MDEVTKAEVRAMVAKGDIEGARKLLKLQDTPTARQWLAKLNERYPHASARRAQSLDLPIVTGVVFAALIVGVTLGYIASRAISMPAEDIPTQDEAIFAPCTSEQAQTTIDLITDRELIDLYLRLQQNVTDYAEEESWHLFSVSFSVGVSVYNNWYGDAIHLLPACREVARFREVFSANMSDILVLAGTVSAAYDWLDIDPEQTDALIEESKDMLGRMPNGLEELEYWVTWLRDKSATP